MDSLTAAFNDCERMHANATKAVADGRALASSINLPGISGSNLGRHSEQYKHFSGWTWVAVRAIASRIAGQDIFVGRPTPQPRRRKSMGERIEPLEHHPILSAIHRPNPLQTKWSLSFSTVASLLLTGKSHWWIEGEQIWPIPSNWIEPADPLRGSWKLKPFGGIEEYQLPADSIIPIYMPDPSNPFTAVSPLQSQALAVSTDEQIQDAQFRAFAQGVHPDMLVRIGKDQSTGVTPTLTAAQRQEIVTALVRRHAGPHGRHNPLVVDGLIAGVEKLSMSPEEMGFIESGNAVKARILQAFGVNAAIVGELENSNRASSAVAAKHFADTCNPIIELMSEALTRWLGKDEVIIWIEPCRADDEELQLSAWKSARQSGDVTCNEYRRHILNLPDIEGGDERVDALGNPIRDSEPLAKLLEPSRNGRHG